MFTKKEIQSWDLEKLRRKRDQAWEMAGEARQDRDAQDEKRHTEEARQCEVEIALRL